MMERRVKRRRVLMGATYLKGAVDDATRQDITRVRVNLK